jgi:osmotically-inducible protein OsmY
LVCLNMKKISFIFILCLITVGCSSLGPKSDDAGKRTFGTKLDDRRTQSLAKRNIKAADPRFKKAHFKITSYNGTVLLTGQVASDELVETASKVVEDMRNITQVHNELEVSGPISWPARRNDDWLKTKLKTSMATNSKTDSNRIKVVVENGIVYLMGLLTREEGEAAVVQARKTYGVQKIVKVFEYLN